MTDIEEEVKQLGDQEKYKDLPQVTSPPILNDSPFSREEHQTSLDTLQTSMRMEMAAMFEKFLGNKSTGPIDPSIASLVNLIVVEVKPSNNGSTSAKNIGPTPKENGGSRRGTTIPPLDKYTTPPNHYPMPHINNMGTPPKIDSRNLLNCKDK
jgi:hypothetical protein